MFVSARCYSNAVNQSRTVFKEPQDVAVQLEFQQVGDPDKEEILSGNFQESWLICPRGLSICTIVA